MEKPISMKTLPPSSSSRLPLRSLIVLCAALLSACASSPVRPTAAASAASDGPRVFPRAQGTQLLLDAAPVDPTPPVVAAAGPAAPTSPAAMATPSAETDEAVAGAPIDPLRPDRPIDLYDDTASKDLWVRVRRGFGMPDLSDDFVRNREQFYAGKPDYVKRMTERGGRYLFHVVEEVEKRGMPTELALLPFIESAFNPQAMSSARASGMWQFIPATGKDYALKQNLFRDDRRDVLASTRAALDYLGRLHTMFGDWHLALAAYNWGEGNVQRAIARNQKAGLPADYASLKMPDETRYYVPKLQAVKNIVLKPDDFHLALPPLKNHPYFLAVPIERDIDVDLAVRLAGVSSDEFKQLNPQMNKPVILAAGTEQVLLPYDNANLFIRNLKSHKGQTATWTAWVAPKTSRPSDVAKQVGMGETELREINRIPPKMLVKAGSTLLVPRAASRTADVSEHLADNATMDLAPDLPPMKKLNLRAGKRGESVAGIAKRYKVSPAQVAQWNRVTADGKFKAGSTIVVMVPLKAAGRGAARAAVAPATRGGRATTVAAKSTPRETARSGTKAKTAVAIKNAAPSKSAVAKPRAALHVAHR